MRSVMNLDIDLPNPLNPPFAPRPTLSELGRVHFIGMGGAGMSALARLMLQAGMQVSGSDRFESPVLEQLRELGARICVPQAAENISGADTVVISTAIRDDNPELAEAVAKNLRVLHRSQALAATMGDSRVIAVAGTHGKTTTSSMIALMIDALGCEPSFAVGSIIAGLATNARLGDTTSRSWFVAEADESDGSFVRYRPQIAVVTNAEPDHLDFYGSADRVMEAFNRFAASIEPGGVLVTCLDDPGTAALAQRCREAGIDVVTYGESAAADVRLSNITGEGVTCSSSIDWDFSLGGQNYSGSETLVLHLPGRHNQLNAAASFICGLLTGAPAPAVLDALRHFRGADRRFTLRGEIGAVKVFDDYAHHPTEVDRALEAGRTVAAGHNLYVLFQPHLFSRTREFSSDFARALSRADRAYVLDIYPARELPIEGVTSRLITDAGYSEIHYADSGDSAVELIVQQVQPGDVVMTVGAGNVTDYGPQIVRALSMRVED